MKYQVNSLSKAPQPMPKMTFNKILPGVNSRNPIQGHFLRIIFLLFSIVSANTAFAKLDLSVTQSSDSVDRYDIFEVTFHHERSYPNPWEKINITVEFIHLPSQERFTVGGFYYDRFTWKARFAPIQTGSWSYQYRFTDGTDTLAGSGSFLCIPSDNPGFIRINPENPYQFVFDNGDDFFPLGFGSCNQMNMFGFDGPDRWKVRDKHTAFKPNPPSLDVDSYFKIFREAGFNIYRWSNNNCSYSVYQRIGRHGNRYRVKEGLLLDELCRTLKKYKYRMIFVPFNTKDLTKPRFVTDTLQVEAVKRYLKYCIDRWGAFVDIWELFNEKRISREWLAILVPFVRENDPYSHLVTSNPSKVAAHLFDLYTEHYYERKPNSLIDKKLIRKYKKKSKRPKKPLIYTEYGNRQPYSNYHPLRYRVFIWTAFMNQQHLIFWNNSFAKYDSGGVGNYTNVYLGPEERALTKVFTRFIEGFPGKLHPVKLPVSAPAKVRVHAIAAPNDLMAYFYYFADRPDTRSGREDDTGPLMKGLTVQVPVPRGANKAVWLDPATGTVLECTPVKPGKRTLRVPDFMIDIALRITGNHVINQLCSKAL